MVTGAWICLLSPLAAAGLITLGGTRLSSRATGYLATASCFVAFGGALASLMLLLVQGGNLLLLLAGWGMVGLSSYLLIGFWHDRPSAVAAAKKAFVMNAIGDATMALAFFLLIQHRQTLSFGILNALHGHSGWVLNLVALGLLGGAVAKSAQLPLQTWLPDAMEGPTPVSALIHAATMVTAGVYLIVRT